MCHPTTGRKARHSMSVPEVLGGGCIQCSAKRQRGTRCTMDSQTPPVPPQLIKCAAVTVRTGLRSDNAHGAERRFAWSSPSSDEG